MLTIEILILLCCFRNLYNRYHFDNTLCILPFRILNSSILEKCLVENQVLLKTYLLQVNFFASDSYVQVILIVWVPPNIPNCKHHVKIWSYCFTSNEFLKDPNCPKHAVGFDSNIAYSCNLPFMINSLPHMIDSFGKSNT